MRHALIWFSLTFFMLQVSSEPQKPPPDSKTVKADPEFATQYNDLMALQVTIKQLEDKNGITKLREMTTEKIAALRKWIADHHLEGWTYDERTQTFSEPKTPPIKTPPAPEKKP